MFSERAQLRVSVQTNQWFPNGPPRPVFGTNGVGCQKTPASMTRRLTVADFPQADFWPG
jgi:hypothetical protein